MGIYSYLVYFDYVEQQEDSSIRTSRRCIAQINCEPHKFSDNFAELTAKHPTYKDIAITKVIVLGENK